MADVEVEGAGASGSGASAAAVRRTAYITLELTKEALAAGDLLGRRAAMLSLRRPRRGQGWCSTAMACGIPPGSALGPFSAGAPA